MPSAKKQSKTYYVYIIECCYGTFYCGYTDDIDNRFAMHASGQGAKYLRGKAPLTLRYVKQYPNATKARKAEAAIKKLSRLQKEQLILNK